MREKKVTPPRITLVNHNLHIDYLGPVNYLMDKFEELWTIEVKSFYKKHSIKLEKEPIGGVS